MFYIRGISSTTPVNLSNIPHQDYVCKNEYYLNDIFAQVLQKWKLPIASFSKRYHIIYWSSPSICKKCRIISVFLLLDLETVQMNVHIILALSSVQYIGYCIYYIFSFNIYKRWRFFLRIFVILLSSHLENSLSSLHHLLLCENNVQMIYFTHVQYL